MPFCKRLVETWGDQFPIFDELMSRTGFRRRVDLRVERSRKVTAVWKGRQKNPERDVPSEPLPPVVFASGGASLGNVLYFISFLLTFLKTRDLFIPDEHP